MKGIHIAKGLKLPLDTVTESIGLLAKRRAGKSTTARKIAEQLFLAGQQVVVADPKGDWWGIRYARNGRDRGLPFVILGGEHGDVPLEVHSGELVARMVVQEHVSMVLDLSIFRKNEVTTFMTAYMETLYRLKAVEKYRTPMMQIIDEADAIAPQKPYKGQERMLGAAEDLVRRGGQRGIGVMMATQRAAVLNKNVLTQIGMMVWLRTIAPQDMAAADDWINVHGTREQRRTLMDSLPSLPIGDAWFWAPGWPTQDGIFKRVHVDLPQTFDSFATPKAGERKVTPKNAADVDLDAFKKEMASTIEKQKSDDPQELRKRIRALERELAQATKKAAPPDERQLEKARQEGRRETAAEVKRLGNELSAAERKLNQVRKLVGNEPETTLYNETHTSVKPRKPTAKPTVPVPPAPRHHKPSRPTGSDATLSKCERGILQVLSQFPEGCVMGKIALLAGYRVSGGFRNSLSVLRTAEFIEGANTGVMAITSAGLGQGPFDPMPTGQELIRYWLTHPRFGKCEKGILEQLVDRYPSGLTLHDLAEASGYQASGGFRNSLSVLRTAGLLEGRNPGEMKASATLMGEA